DDRGMAGSRPHLGLEAERLDVPGQMIGRLLAILREGRVGRDRLDAQQVEQPREAVVEIGIDMVEHRLQFCVGHGGFPYLGLLASGCNPPGGGDKAGGCRMCQTRPAASTAVAARLLPQACSSIGNNGSASSSRMPAV